MAKYKRGSLALARQVFNTPQLIVESDLQRISQYLVDRANGVEVNVINTNDVEQKTEKQELQSLIELASYETEEEKQRYHRRLNITNDGKRGNLFIEGALVAKAGEIDADCMELTSYEKLLSTFQMQVKEGIEELVLHVDSGGGAAATCFEMANEVKTLANEKNIKIYAYIDGMAASAAYAWTSIADEIISRPDSEAGSIGVVVQLINNSKMLSDIGITRKFITYGDNKAPFDDQGEFTDKFLESIQKKVNKTGLEFSNFVAKNRNMNVEDVIALQAEIFTSEDALSLGLVDKIMTRSEFFDKYLPSAKASSNNQYYLQQEDIMSKEKDVTVDTQLSVEQLQEQLTNLNVEKEQLTTQVDTLTQQLADFQSTKEQLQTLQANYDALLGEKEASDKAAKLATRKAAIEDAIGKDNEQVASLLSSTEQLEDTAFEIVVSSLSTQQELKQEKLKEKGNEGTQSPSQLSIEEKLAATAKKMTKQSA